MINRRRIAVNSVRVSRQWVLITIRNPAGVSQIAPG